MKQGEAARLVTSLLRADKVLHEQQLGWAWHPPSADLFQPVGNMPTEGGENEDPEDPPGEREGSWLEAVGEEYRPMLRTLCDEAGYLVPGKVEEVVRGKLLMEYVFGAASLPHTTPSTPGPRSRMSFVVSVDSFDVTFGPL